MFHDQNYGQQLPRERIEYLQAEYRRADVRQGDRVDDRQHAVISVSTDDANDFVYASKGMRLRLMWGVWRSSPDGSGALAAPFVAREGN